MDTNYDDIINLPHHVSKNRKRMSNYDRAAQFSPFAALKGYDDEIDEVARITDEKWDLDGERVTDINEKLLRLKDAACERPLVKIVYFVKDERKSGGAYLTAEAHLKKLSEYDRTLIFDNGLTISFDDVFSIELKN